MCVVVYVLLRSNVENNNKLMTVWSVQDLHSFFQCTTTYSARLFVSSIYVCILFRSGPDVGFWKKFFRNRSWDLLLRLGYPSPPWLYEPSQNCSIYHNVRFETKTKGMLRKMLLSKQTFGLRLNKRTSAKELCAAHVCVLCERVPAFILRCDSYSKHGIAEMQGEQANNVGWH